MASFCLWYDCALPIKRNVGKHVIGETQFEEFLFDFKISEIALLFVLFYLFTCMSLVISRPIIYFF